MLILWHTSPLDMNLSQEKSPIFSFFHPFLFSAVKQIFHLAVEAARVLVPMAMLMLFLGFYFNFRNIWKRRTLFSPWKKVPNSCCVKDVTTFQDECGGPQYIVGVGMNGKLYSKRTLGGRWSGPYAHSGTVKAVAGVRGTIYGVGMNNHVYKRYDLRGHWVHIRGSCCVKDISVRDVNGHPVYGKIYVWSWVGLSKSSL